MSLAATKLGRRRYQGGLLPRHNHRDGYIAVVLAGGYVEAGSNGRRGVQAGDVLIHRAFDAHMDRFDVSGAEVLNLPLPQISNLPVCARIADPDAVMLLAERDRWAAALMIAKNAEPVSSQEQDWPDILAAKLKAGKRISLRRWADHMSLAPETVSRGFKAAYGTSPSRFFADLRAQAAWERLCSSSHEPLAAIAAELGFSDQSHMTREVRALTGASPTYWRPRTKSTCEPSKG